MILTSIFLAAMLAQSSGEPNKLELESLNHDADQFLAAYDLDRAEPLLKQALALATHLGPGPEAAAHARLGYLYMDLQKRDGQNWRNLALPHILSAIGVAKAPPSEMRNRLVANLALAVLQLPPGGLRPDLSPAFAKLLSRWLADLEIAEGPLNAKTALPYLVLSYAANDSEAQLHSIHACDLLAESDHAPAEFSSLLIRCADFELAALSEVNAIRLARFARATAAAGGRRYDYETVVSYIIEAEAQTASNSVFASSAIESAGSLARKWLAPGHPIWERILSDQQSLVRLNRQTTLATRVDPLAPNTSRVRPAKISTRVNPEYTKEARASKFEGTTLVAVLVTSDGKGTVYNTYQALPYGLQPSVDKAIREWTFEPWTLDGKPVTGMSVLEVAFRLKN